MSNVIPDLKAEQQATLRRKPYAYSLLARVFVAGMDLFAGKTTTLSKAKLLEIFAGVPYRLWEVKHYRQMTRRFGDRALVERCEKVVAWAREAQDNELWHLFVLHEKMKSDGAADAWYLTPPIPALMMASYRLFAGLMATLSMRRAFLFNAEFEDHAEHTYAQLVADHPEWDDQPVEDDVIRTLGGIVAPGELATWGDVFRRIALDEREHMNHSFVFCGKPGEAV